MAINVASLNIFFMHYKTKTSLFLIVVFLFTLLFACTKQVDYLLEDSESIPIIQSIMSPDRLITVYVAQSVGALDNGFNFIADATVLLYREDVFVDTLKFNSDNKYYSNVYPVAGKKYKVVVEMPDGKKLWGETTIPLKPIACNPVFTPNLIYFEQAWFGKLELQINDTSFYPNYYELLVFGFDTVHGHNYYQRLNFYEMDQVVINEGDWGFNPRTIFFSDELFNGKKYDFNCMPSHGISTSTTGDSLVYCERLRTSLRNTSYSYYKYRKSYTRHIYNSGIQTDGLLNLISTGNPVDMYSNVNGGLGVVGSYNQIIEKFKKKI